MVAEVIEGGRPLLLLADHAGFAVPADIALGVGDDDLARHIAGDLGTDPLARALAERLDATAILARVSRLVVDLNRTRDDPAAVPLASDGTDVPGNRLSAHAREARLARWHDGYHDLVAGRLAARRPELIVSVHSFTPGLSSGPQRPWDAGVLYNRDERTGRAMLAALADSGWVVGDQQPYPGTRFNATLDRHGEAAGIPSVLIEVRQDHLADPAGVARVAGVLATAIRRVHACVAPAAVEGSRP